MFHLQTVFIQRKLPCESVRVGTLEMCSPMTLAVFMNAEDAMVRLLED